MEKVLISIVLPVFNQADHIAQIVEQYEQTLSKSPLQYEFVMVINGCKDESLKVCEELSEKYSKIKVVESQESGWGLAVRLGLKEARGDIICYTNSARTSPENLLLFLLYAVSNPDVVIKANRRSRKGWLRRIGSLIYNIECRLIHDLPYWDINGTPKVFPRKFEKLMQLSQDKDLIDLEFNCACQKENYPMFEIPIFSFERYGGTSTTGWFSAIALYWGAFRLRKSLRGAVKEER